MERCGLQGNFGFCFPRLEHFDGMCVNEFVCLAGTLCSREQMIVSLCLPGANVVGDFCPTVAVLYIWLKLGV